MSATARFSSRCRTDEVPGISSTFRATLSAHANALWAGLRGAGHGRRALFALPCAWLLGGLLGATSAAAGANAFLPSISLLLLLVSMDQPGLRFVLMGALAAGGLFLRRTFAVGLVGFVLGLVPMIVLTSPDFVPSPELMVRLTLWLGPVFALGMLALLGHPPTWMQIAGGALVVAGLAQAQVHQLKLRRTAPEPVEAVAQPFIR